MSSSNVANLFEREIPTCVWVQIGDLKFVAVIATGCSSSLITENAYNKIHELSNKSSIIVKEFKKTKIGDLENASEKFKCINLNAFIGGEPVLLQLTITPTPGLENDLVLGCDFIEDVQGGFNFEIQAFKWQSNDKITITNFLSEEEFSSLKLVNTSDPNLSMPVKSNECKLEDQINQKHASKVLENPSSVSEDSSVNSASCEKMRFAKNQSNIGKTKSHKENSESKDETLSDKRPDTKSSELHAKDDCLYKNWKTVHIMTKTMHNLLGGLPLVFNGIYWSKGSKHNIVFQDNFKDKTLFGCHLFAIAKVMQTAIDNKWSHLRIYSNFEMIVDWLNVSFMKGIIPSKKACSELTTTEFRALRFIHLQLFTVSPVKFEFVSIEDFGSSKMELLERMIDSRFLNL